MKKIDNLIKDFVKEYLWKRSRGKIVNEYSIRRLMEEFNADEEGHKAKISEADLGYAWIHYGLIRTIKPKKVLCIGSRYGFIPAVLAQSCKDNLKGLVDFVDPGYGINDKNHWTGVGYWKSEKGKNCFKNYGLDKWIKLYIMSSLNYAKKFNKNYEYIYIDGDHSYKGVSLDYKLFWPRLERGGFMTLHDISVNYSKIEGIYGVHRLWKKIGKERSFALNWKVSGLGVVQKK